MKNSISKVISAALCLLLLCGVVTISQPYHTVSAASKLSVNVSHPAMNTIKLSWSKVSGAEGYNIYYSETKDGTYKIVSRSKDTSIVFDNLTVDTRYYFKVSAYKVSGGVETESAISDILTVNSNSVGIDVSKWNGTIDWAKVKADYIDYAIVRVAYGTSTTAETKYKDNISGAIKAGIPVGVYIYSTATTTAKAKEEATYVLNLIKGYDITYPICFDIEDSANKSLSKSTNTSIVKTFCDAVKAAGYTPMVYTGCSFSETYLTMSSLKSYDWWIAHYGSTTQYLEYSGTYHFRSSADPYKTSPTRMWQYSEHGKVNGISGSVDMNYELDLDETVNGMIHVDLKKGQETYVAASGETLKTIASKFDVSVSKLIENDSKYTTSSSISEGKSIIIDTVTLVAPVVTAEVTSTSSVKISWKACLGAEGYYVYHATSENGTYSKLKTTSSKSYTHSNINSGEPHYYKVVAYATHNGVKTQAKSEAVASMITVNKVETVQAVSKSYNSNKISWTAVEGADGYRIYSSTSKTGKYKKIKATSSTSYTNKDLENKVKVYYKVVAYRKVSGVVTEAEPSAIVSAKPMQPSVTNLAASSTTESSITLSWTKSSNATSYQIYRATSEGGAFTKLKTVTTTSYTNKSLTAGNTYYYKVRAVRKVDGKNYYSSFTSVLNATPTGDVPVITSVTAYQGRVVMNWTTVKNATGYEIYRSTSKNGTYKMVIRKGPATINNTGLESNKTYYYKVRSYRIVNGVYKYSDYSSIISVKTK